MKPLFVATALLTTLLGTLMVTGCTTNPYTGEKQVSKAAIGAGIGAIVGAAVSDKDHRKQGALIGAAGGAGIGVYMDVQEKKLRDKLQGTGVGVQRNKETGEINLIMPGNITFATNSADIRSDFYSVLESVAIVLKEYNGKQNVLISGHTDNVGKDDHNQSLSERRAQSVASYLGSHGVAPASISSLGYGKRTPIASNDSEQGRAQNRRVEIKLEPKQ